MPDLKAVIVPVTPFQQNCAIVWDEATKRGVVVDPGGDVAGGSGMPFASRRCRSSASS